MIGLTSAARSVLLTGGLPGLLSYAGGTIKVALFNNGVEVSGNGYSRKSATGVGSVTTDSDGDRALALTPASVFTASGGSIIYDQYRLLNNAGSEVLGYSDEINTITIPNGQNDTVTVSFKFITAPTLTSLSVLTDALSGPGDSILFNRGVMSDAGTVTLTGPRKLTIRDVANLDIVFTWDGTSGLVHLILDGCHLADPYTDALSLLDLNGSKNYICVQITNCFNSLGARIPDLELSRLAGGTSI